MGDFLTVSSEVGSLFILLGIRVDHSRRALLMGGASGDVTIGSVISSAGGKANLYTFDRDLLVDTCRNKRVLAFNPFMFWDVSVQWPNNFFDTYLLTHVCKWLARIDPAVADEVKEVMLSEPEKRRAFFVALIADTRFNELMKEVFSVRWGPAKFHAHLFDVPAGGEYDPRRPAMETGQYVPSQEAIDFVYCTTKHAIDMTLEADEHKYENIVFTKPDGTVVWMQPKPTSSSSAKRSKSVRK